MAQLLTLFFFWIQIFRFKKKWDIIEFEVFGCTRDERDAVEISSTFLELNK